MKATSFLCLAWFDASIAQIMCHEAGKCWRAGYVCDCVAHSVIVFVHFFVFCVLLDRYADAKSKEEKKEGV